MPAIFHPSLISINCRIINNYLCIYPLYLFIPTYPSTSSHPANHLSTPTHSCTNLLPSKHPTQVSIKDVDENAMELLLDFCYTSSIVIEESNVQSLLPAACLLQLSEIQDSCCEFLQKQLDPTNCLGGCGGVGRMVGVKGDGKDDGCGGGWEEWWVWKRMGRMVGVVL